MLIDPNLNTILKLMWDINERIKAKKFISLKEQQFYNEHLEEIKDYYHKNHFYWTKQQPLDLFKS